MKILHFVHTAYPEANGIANHLYYLQKSLPKEAQAIIVHGKGIAIPGFSSMRIPLAEFWRALFIPCDIIHVHGWSLFSAFGAILARLRKKPLVWTVHGVPKFEDKRKWLLKLFNFLFLGWLKSADEIISVSHDEVVVGWQEEMKKRGKKINYIPNGVDAGLFKPFGSYKKAKYVGYFGRLDKDKGVEEIAKIKKFPILLAGQDEGMLQKIKRIMKGRLKHIKKSTHDKVPLVYAKCRYVILPSKYEGFPLVMLEALACQRPFIASAAGEMPIVLRQLFGKKKWKKYMLEPTRGIEDVLLELEKHDLQPELEAARKIIKQKFSWKIVASKTFEIYKKAILAG
jgi:glycosyltransferase involved in cell wall biosynthesis